MSRHEVKMWLSTELPVGNVDIEFPVRVDGGALGRLQVSTGSVDWLPSPKRKAGYWLSWSEFADLMAEHGHEK